MTRYEAARDMVDMLSVGIDEAQHSYIRDAMNYAQSLKDERYEKITGKKLNNHVDIHESAKKYIAEEARVYEELYKFMKHHTDYDVSDYEDGLLTHEEIVCRFLDELKYNWSCYSMLFL